MPGNARHIRTRLETERLVLRLFTRDDVQAMYEMSSDPDVIRYAEPEPAKDLDDAMSRLEAGPLHDYETYGYGRFAVELKETVGWAGGVLICMMVVIAHKQWYWGEMTRRALSRDIKRLQLQVAELASSQES